MARSSTYTKEIGDLICLRLIQGESLTQICKDDHMPERHTVIRWCDTFPEFSTQYARAREALMDFYADEILEISDNESRDYYEIEETHTRRDGSKVVSKKKQSDNTAVNRDRLKADSRKWIMSKLAPKKFGDLQKIEHSGEIATTAVLEIGFSSDKRKPGES